MLAWTRADAAETETHRYTVAVDQALNRLSVEARFQNPVNTVAARSRHAGRYLLDVRGCDDAADVRLRNRRMMLPEEGIGCLRYAVDLGRAATRSRDNHRLATHVRVLSPSYWLWRPELVDETRIRVDFQLPDGLRVSVPWRQLDAAGTRFLLTRSPESASAPAVFGRFDYREIPVAGATLRVSLLDGLSDMDNDAVVDWVRATATDVSLAYGRFPSPSPQVVIMPVTSRRSSSPVPFGRVIRDGGETVELYVDPGQALENFFEDWTATHEFSHLLHPYLRSDHHWITEGFAQYYQNVLLARSGAYDARDAWQKLYAGLERGRKSRPELSPNEATARSARGSRMKVYWSGAALALIADVTLRERSNGEETLDNLLERFQSCCLPSDRAWTGPEFFSRLDSLATSPVFMPLYERYADTPGFPETAEIFERLGIRVTGNRVRLWQSADLADIREAITRTVEPVAKWRSDLAAD